MVDIMLLTKTTEKIGLATVQDKIIDLAIDRPNRPQLIGSILKAKVITVDTGLQAAYLEIGLKHKGYLEKKELPASINPTDKPIESVLFEGQTLFVQVVKDAYQEKGARLTANITLPGENIVYLPYGQRVAVSKKIADNQGEELAGVLGEICADHEGLIIRTEAVNYSIQELTYQIEQLRQLWHHLRQDAKNEKPPYQIWHDQTVSDQLIKKFSGADINMIYCDQATTVRQLKQRYPKLIEKVVWDKQLTDRLPITVDHLFEQLLDPVVVCQHGITLHIDHTEALTVIDVNSAGYTGKRGSHQTAYAVNKIAAVAIAEQLRLRNISGIIVIDFVRMRKAQDQAKLQRLFTDKLKQDALPIKVFGFTGLGLFELTRKRETPIHQFTIGQSTEKTVRPTQETMVFQLERQLVPIKEEATVVEVTEGFKQLWNKWINHDLLQENLQTTVYFSIVKGVHHYHLKRIGSEALIQEYIAKKKQQNIDKIN
ncbi:ribonuclease E/G [Amphibacillus cookii]|uniref:ribonuclease E/G n=1 Tax=Amphibacillus cookii TaxID=767787 RepID=UPI00195C37E5|nr:ribonuclease E/G [Amphibacillus cookii]MBM7541775.1 ribonuclease G [Amphibacillus cookii]